MVLSALHASVSEGVSFFPLELILYSVDALAKTPVSLLLIVYFNRYAFFKWFYKLDDWEADVPR